MAGNRTIQLMRHRLSRLAGLVRQQAGIVDASDFRFHVVTTGPVTASVAVYWHTELMTRITLTAGNDLVQRLAGETDPVRAVIELVWNSLDADANKVSVTLDRNTADGIVGVTVRDDGLGMGPERVEQDFKWVGNSWKLGARVTEREKRPLHGRLGQGRLRAFALGTRITWETVGQDATGAFKQTRVSSTIDHRNDFSGPDPVDAQGPSYTEFRAEGRDSLGRLEGDSARPRIGAALALHLLTYPSIDVSYDGVKIDPAASIERETAHELKWSYDGVEHRAALKVVEWRDVKSRTLYLCDESGVPIDETPIRRFADFSFAAYVLWDGMAEHANEVLLVHMEQETSLLGSLMKIVDSTLEDHFEARRAEQRRQLVDRWKETKTYPYEGDPASDEEMVERATFDVVATSVRRHIPKTRGQEKLTLGLLKDTLQRNPDGVKTLLNHYVGLTEGESEELDRLLERTPLSRLIRATTDVTDRLDFLSALREIVFNPETKGLVKERDHLHKILESESWVFGEQFNMMSSEIGLTRALKQHLSMLGREGEFVTKVTKTDGSQGRLDLMFSLAAPEHETKRHLVVELKAPSVVASYKEANQIKGYARAIVEDPQFAGTHTVWDFVLVVNDYNNDVRRDINQRGRESGLLDESELDPNSPLRYRVWVRRWSEILEAADQRLLYYKRGLQHDASLLDVKRYLRENHADVLPEGLFSEADVKSDV